MVGWTGAGPPGDFSPAGGQEDGPAACATTTVRTATRGSAAGGTAADRAATEHRMMGLAKWRGSPKVILVLVTLAVFADMLRTGESFE